VFIVKPIIAPGGEGQNPLWVRVYESPLLRERGPPRSGEG